jgi:hypothetical protein
MASSAAKKRAEQRDTGTKGPVLSVEHDGVQHTWWWKNMTPYDSSAMRTQMGLSPMQLLHQLETAPDLDHAAAIIWMARRQNGEPELNYTEVADTITFGDDWRFISQQEIADRGPAEEKGDVPEA